MNFFYGFILPRAPRVIVLVLAALCGNLAPAQSDRAVEPDVGIRFQPPTLVALTNATVVDANKTLANATLLIDDGRIQALGTGIEIPNDAEVVDCGGDYLYPAFVDAYVEFDSENLVTDGQHWNANVTPHRSMAESIKLEESKLEALRKAGIGIVLAAPNEGIFKGQSCVISTAGTDLATSMLRSDGFQHVRLYPSRRSSQYPNSPMGAVALVRQTFSDASWYQSAKRAAMAQPQMAAPEYNSALESLLPVIEGSQTLIIDGPNELYELRADRMAREFSLPLVIRGSGREYRRLEAIASSGRRLIVPVDFPDAPELETEQQLADATLQELMDWDLAPTNPARLQAAGVEFVLSTDGLDDPKKFVEQLRKAVEAGLDKGQALRAVTLGPAELLQVEELAGTLDRGKLANILRTSGPLFDSKTTVKETWVQGERFPLKPDDENELAGTWQISWNDGGLPELDLQIEGSAAKPKASLGLRGAFVPSEEASDEEKEAAAEEAGDDASSEGEDAEETSDDEEELASVKFKAVALQSSGLSGTFSADQLNQEEAGVAFLSATALKTESETELSGTVVWASGKRSGFRATRLDDDDSKADHEEDSHDDEGHVATSDKAGDGEPEEAEEVEDRVSINYPLGAYGRTQEPELPEWIVFRDATIWTCGEAGILESADLLVHSGKIKDVGVDLEVPEGTQVVDASGMHITPGIIDCHSHMATDGGVNESGQAITAEVRIGDFIDPNDITIYRHLAGGVTTANILHGSANPIGGQNQVIKLRWGGLDNELKMAEAPAGIKFALGENVKQSRYREGTRYPRSRMGVEQILRDRFEAAKLYRQKWSDWTTSPNGLPPRRDYELDAIAEILEGKRWIHCHSYRQDEILATLRVLEDYGITIGSLQHILEGYKVAEAMAAHGATGSSFSDWWAYKFEVYDAIPHNGALMHRAGVVVSFNSDDRELARHLNHEAAKAVKYGGVSEEEALKFVTLNPAKQLRIDEWVGSLEAGKHADFVLWNRSPLSTLSACMQTWVDGRKYFDRELDKERQQQDETLRLGLIQKVVDSGARTGSRRDDDPSYWWARHDEFCHHFDEDHDHDHEHYQEQTEQ